MSTGFDQVIELIDQANRQDPNVEFDLSFNAQPKEWLYSQRMSARLKRFCPEASVHLRIAAHGQHIERWTSPRSNYPDGRTGYKQWRAELGLFHAKRVGELMAQAGFSDDDIKRTQYLVQKRGLKRDAESQALEDVICLVFIEFYLEEFAKKHDEPKLIDIIQKTWGKMSEAGHQAALAIHLTPAMQALIGKALQA